MKNITKRLINKCRREATKRMSWYKRQKQLLFEVVEELDTRNDMSFDMLHKAISPKLKKVSKNVILDNISMAYLPFMVYLFYLRDEKSIEFLPVKNDCIIKVEGANIARMSYLAVYIHFIEIKDDILYVEGNTSWFAPFKDRSNFGVKHNYNKVSCKLYEGGLDLKKGDNAYETRMVYSIEVPLKEDVNVFEFCNYVDGNECNYGKINCMRFSPVADCIKYQYSVRNGWIIYIEGNKLCCEEATDTKIKEREKLYIEELLRLDEAKGNEVKKLRDEYRKVTKEKKKPVWLFMDRIDRADDNGEVLFEYVRKHQNDVEAYFIIRDDVSDYEKLKPLGNIIAANTKEHLLMFMMADCIISSQANGVIENPFGDDAEYYRDLYHQGKIIFLQHGVTKDDMSLTLDRYNTNFKGIITSSKYEKQSFTGEPCYYRENEVWLTGMPRFDALYDNTQKYILLMPSWRKSLMEQVWSDKNNDMIWQVKDDFMESDYVRAYNAVLCDERLRKACDEYGYKMAFMPHALMEPFIDRFEKSEHCMYWDSNKSYRDAFAEGSILVTDYSSVAFDFAYLKKPVVYYQFDKDTFFKEHTYKKGYYDYEKDGFGPVTHNKEELINILIDYMEKGCKIEDIYDDRIENFFAYIDKNCCKRICDILLKL